MHVATFVRNTEGQWIALDTLSPEPVTLEQWYDHYAGMQNPEAPQNMRIYSTDPSRFSVKSNWRYNRWDLGFPDKLKGKEDVYKGYFIDMLKALKEH